MYSLVCIAPASSRKHLQSQRVGPALDILQLKDGYTGPAHPTGLGLLDNRFWVGE